MKYMFALLLSSVLWAQAAYAGMHPFAVHIRGSAFDTQERLALSDIGEGKTAIHVRFKSRAGQAYNFDMQYHQVSKRSHPASLDITLSDMQGNPLGRLSFAVDHLDFFKQLGVFGFKVNIDGEPVDVQLVWSGHKKGHVQAKDLTQERFFQDTQVPKWGFQMPHTLSLKPQGSHTLDAIHQLGKHPYAVRYTIVDRANGGIRFKHQLYRLEQNTPHLLSSVYFNADDLQTLRKVSYVAEHFDAHDGVFKLIFYTPLGQSKPKKH